LGTSVQPFDNHLALCCRYRAQIRAYGGSGFDHLAAFGVHGEGRSVVGLVGQTLRSSRESASEPFREISGLRTAEKWGLWNPLMRLPRTSRVVIFVVTLHTERHTLIQPGTTQQRD